MAGTVNLAWRRELAGTFGISQRAVTVIGLALLGLLGAVSAFISGVIPAFDEISPAAARRVHLVALASVTLVAAASAVMFQVLAPRRTSLTVIAQLLPVSRFVTRVGAQLPMVALSVLTTLAMTSPSLKMTLTGGTHLLAGLAAVGALVVTVHAVAIPLFNTAVWALRRARLPLHHGLGIAGAVVLAGAFAAVWHDLAAPAPTSNVWWVLPHRTAAEALSSLPAAAVLAVWTVMALGAGAWAMSVLPEERVDRPSRLLARLPWPSGQAAARVWYELLVLVRAPQYAVAILFAFVGVVAATVLYGATGTEVVRLAASGLFLVFFFAGMQSVGLTLPSHWIGEVLLARPAAWAWPKALACLLAATVAALAALAVAFTTGLLVPATSVSLLLLVLPAWAAAMLAGALVPYSHEQPLSVGLTAVTTTIVYAAATWAAGEVVPSAWLSALVTTAVLLAAYVGVARRMTKRPRHG
ncbi:hypothetical protein GCM10022402_36640 [Salinactinospora qingdaonensis]|uniref:ABC-2 type transport system permease protein n=2 Tax=Salinactinospora qingdaonensis TaxID=702744 RepID=A0ABP7G971_9ACTN